MPTPRTRATMIAAVALATSATLGLASAATAAEVATYPLDAYPGVTVASPHPNYEIELDCVDLEAGLSDNNFYDDLELVWVPGGTLTVSLTCTPDDVTSDSINEGLDEGDYPSGYDSVTAGSGFVTAYEVDPNTEIEFFIGTESLRVYYYASLEIDDPTGSKLVTETMTTPANGAQSVDFADGDALDVDDFECGLEAERVYAAVQFTVLEGGEFTFRVVDVSPLQSGEYRDQGDSFEWWYYYPNPWGDYVPISDPYLVLYSSFDPAMPNEGQIDCNDDTNAINTPSGVQAHDSSGRFISDLYPELVVDLVPGDYTLLVTTYDEVESVDITTTPAKVDAASIPLTPANYEFEGLPEQSAIVEFWGAEGSLDLLGADADPELADTGADGPLQAGLALGAVLALLLGALGIAVARRRTV